MPSFRFRRSIGIGRNVRVFLNLEGGVSGADDGRPGGQVAAPEKARRPVEEELEVRKQELCEIRTGLLAAKRRTWTPERYEHLRKVKSKQQEIFGLEMKLRGEQDGEETGALPDFAVIGGAKCGTTFFYHVLAQHPHIEPAAMKETHYFDRLYDKGTGWYRGCFPPPRLKDGRMTITGEATPGYIFDPVVPERMARVVPDVRLISLLRNPVDRTYSAYHHRMRNNRKLGSFDEEVDKALRADGSLEQDRNGPIPGSIYVEHLLRWSRFFPRERMLVLKSEDFFERPAETLASAVEFLGLPGWEPDPSEFPVKRENRGGYEQKMDPATSRRLEEFFGPHNRRLYEYLGRDLGW